MPQNGEEECVVCQEAITNPICPECLQKEIEQWLVDKDESLVPKLRSYTSVYGTFRHVGTGCIICGNNMKVCAHCYCKDIYELFSDELGPEANEFLYSFNFELDKPAG